MMSTPGCEIIQQGKGELLALKIEMGSPAFYAWKDHYLPGGLEPDHLDNSDPVYIPLHAPRDLTQHQFFQLCQVWKFCVFIHVMPVHWSLEMI